MSFSNVVIGGNLVRDPESKELASGKNVCNFSVAVNGWGDKVAYIDVTAWGKTCDFVCQYFTKGKGIVVIGNLEQDTWEDPSSGGKRSKIFINASSVNFLGPKESNSLKDDIPF